MKVLLIGNDINNATSDYSWSNLLHDLVDYAHLPEPPLMEGKPFPLFYEQIFLNSAKLYGTKEKRLKTYIAVKSRKLQPNLIHEKIIGLGIPTLLTTNYDLTLESVLKANPDKIHNDAEVKESRYNLFRVNHIGKHHIWHIHGSALNPSSITLGYEHYSGYLQQMRNYMVVGTKGIYKKRNQIALARRIKADSVKHESWIDYFFTHDIHIFGLNLDFVEMHLWWLLTYRARAKLLSKLDITNSIYYYYPQHYEERSRYKLELLRANEVKTVPLLMKQDDRIGYYERVLKQIKKN